MNTRFSKVTQEDNLIRRYLLKFFPYWPLFCLLIIMMLASAFVYTKFTTPVYLSSASILINDEKKGTEDSKMMESLNFFSSKKIVENEIEVIHSRTLLAEVANDLKLTGPIFEQRKMDFLSTYKYSSAYVTSPIQIEVRSIIYPEIAKRKNKIFFKYNSFSKQVWIDGNQFPLYRWVATRYGTLKFSENPKGGGDPKYPLFFSLISLNQVIPSLSSQITVKPVSKLSTVVQLTIEDEVPERGNDILNALSKAYYTSSIKAKKDMAENTLHFVENRIQIVEKDLDSLERTIQIFKAREGIVDLSVQGKEFIENVGSNDQKLADINMQLAVLTQVEKYVISKDTKAGIVPSTLGIADPVLTDLLQKLYNAENQYEKVKSLTGINNPTLIPLAGEIEKIRPGILENIRNQRQSLEASKSNVSKTNGTYNTVLSAIPQKEKALLALTRKQSILSNVYTFLLQKREETALSYSSNIADGKIIDTAAASFGPVKPNVNLYYLFAVVIAIAFGVALVTGKELLNGKVLYRSEIETLVTFPIIAEIAYEKTDNSFFVLKNKSRIVAEQFRKLRASLLTSSLPYNSRKILITSTISGDGKSFIAANLGLTFATAGKKVILIELDLTNPSLSKKLKINGAKGISDFLRGEAAASDIIYGTKANENLFIIPSGDLPDNPSELIINGKVEGLFDYLEKNFDYVLVDSAPVSALSDAYILSPICDSTLYIVRHNHTPRAGLRGLNINNEVNELKNLRVIFNGVKQRGFSKSSYGYGYTLGYSEISLKKKTVKLLDNKNF